MPFSDLTDQQQEFCRKYLKYSSIFSGKQKKKQGEIDAEYEKYVRLRERVQQVNLQLAERDTMREAFAKRIAGTEETLKGSGKIKDRLVLACKELVVIESDIQQHLRMEEVNQKKVTPEGQIRFLVNKALVEMRVDLGKVETAQTTVLEKLTRMAEGMDIAIPRPEQFADANMAFNKAFSELLKLSQPGAYTVEAARDVIADTVRDFKTLMDGYESDLLEMADDDPALTAKIENEETATKLREDLSGADEVIEELIRWGAPGAADLRKDSARLTGLAVATHPDLTTTTTDGVVALLKAANDLRQSQVTAYQQGSAELVQRMDALHRTVVEYNKDVEAKRAAQLPQVQEASFLVTMAYDAFAAGKNLGALPGITKMVEDAEQLMYDLKNNVVINGEIVKAIAQADKTIRQHEGSTAIRKEAWTGHREALTKFQTDWPGMRPASAKSAITDMILTLEEEARTEASMAQWRESQRRRLEETRKEFAKLETELKRMIEGNSLPFKGYEGPIKADLDTCAEWIETKESPSWKAPTEKKMGMIQNQIIQLLVNLSGKGSDPEDKNKTGAELKLEAQKQLLDEYDEAIKARSDAAVQKKAFLELSTNWMVTARNDAKASPSARFYRDEVDRIFKQMSDLIADVRKDAQDVTAGKRAFDLLNRQFEGLLSRPIAIDYRKLGQLDEAWTGALDALGKHAESLTGAIRAGIPADDSEAATSAAEAVDVIERQLKVVQAGFRTTAFGEAAKVLGDQDAAPSERKKARETAQAAVRLMRSRLMGDPLLVACQSNPFGISGFASDVFRALSQIELETLRGI